MRAVPIKASIAFGPGGFFSWFFAMAKSVAGNQNGQ
jgi:hypothetical protein